MKRLALLFAFCVATAFSAGVTGTHSTALEASHICATAPATTYSITVWNSKASLQYLLIFDAKTVPDEGTAPTFAPVPLAASSTTMVTFPTPLGTKIGLVVCNSSTSATKTIGSADCWFSVLSQ